MAKPTLHLICTAHLDPVWQWRWEEGAAEAVSTFRCAARLLREHPGLIFCHNEAVLYRWVKKLDPALFDEIRRLVVEERWAVSGGWELQPDVNLPGTESLVRNIAEGRRFFLYHFGVRPRVAYNFDAFGHSGGLPQILRQAGYDMYIHMRPQTDDLELPGDLYRWQGVDGTEIPAYRIAVGLYHTEYENIRQRLEEGTDLALRLGRDVPVFWGIGDHGGGATRKDLAEIDTFIKHEKRVDIIHSTPERFYDAVRDEAAHAPVFKGGLQQVFTGCYTSLSRLKRAAQFSLGALTQTETLQALAWWTMGRDYPEKDLRGTWRLHLFNDFHDIITGTCIEPAERDALQHYGAAADILRRLNLETAAAINSRIDGLAAVDEHISGEIPLTVLHGLPSPGLFPVEAELMIAHRPKWTGHWKLRLKDPKGKDIPCQEEQPEARLPFNGWRRKIVFLDQPEGFGAAHYRVCPEEGEPDGKERPSDLRFEFGESGLIEKWHIENTRQILAGPLLQPLVVEDEGDSWGTGMWSYRNVTGLFVPDKPGLKIVESGPVRTVYEAHLTFNHSRIMMQTFAYAGWPVLEFRLRILWNEPRRRLKLSLPTVIKPGTLLGEIPGGFGTIPADGKEHVHGRWCRIEGTTDGRKIALGIAHTGCHGLDFKNGEIRLSVLRSTVYCHEKGQTIGSFPEAKFMDLGEHEIRFLLSAGDAEDVAHRLPGLADWLSAPPIVYSHLPHGGFRKKDRFDSGNLLSLSPAGVRLLACKRSIDGQALVIRIQETTGAPTAAEVRLAPPDIHRPPPDLLHTSSGGGHFTVPLTPFEIKTLRIERTNACSRVSLVDEIEGCPFSI